MSTEPSNTGGNPSSKAVKAMFSNIGINDIFGNIQGKFQSNSL
jgi:hypothetical protein